MAYRWPDDTVFTHLELHVEEQWCQTCGCRLRVCDHRHRRLFTLHGPLHVVCKLVHCPDRGCPAHPQTLSPEAETTIAMPWWALGWDVVCWLASAALPATGRSGSSVPNWRTRTRFVCPPTRSRPTFIAINRCWRPAARLQT